MDVYIVHPSDMLGRYPEKTLDCAKALLSNASRSCLSGTDRALLNDYARRLVV